MFYVFMLLMIEVKTVFISRCPIFHEWFDTEIVGYKIEASSVVIESVNSAGENFASLSSIALPYFHKHCAYLNC